MKAKIEVVGNLVVILLAVVIGSAFLKDRFHSPGQESNQVKAGDKLPRLDGWDWSAHDRTLVLVLKKGCHFCEDSAPFYQRLAANHRAEGADAAIVAVFPDAADAVNEVVQSEGLGVHALAGVPLEKLKVSGTPSVLLVDKSGTVLNAWIGMLSPKQELEVMRSMACPGNSCGEGA
jgi:thioredoxin-related protein